MSGVIDQSAGAPRDVGSFAPPDIADLTGVLPAKTFVVSVALLTVPRSASARGRDFFVLSDVNAGLYVVDAPWRPERNERASVPFSRSSRARPAVTPPSARSDAERVGEVDTSYGPPS